MSSRNVRVIVIGGGGRIGSRLVQRLAAAGKDVLSIQRSSGPCPSGAELAVARSAAALSDVLAHECVLNECTVINAAGRAHAGRGRAVAGLSEYWDSNVELVASVTKALAVGGAARLIHLSSCKASHAGPTAYGLSKAIGDLLVREIGSVGGVSETYVLRLAPVYGMSRDGSVERLAKLVSLGVPLVVGKGATRDVLFVENLADLVNQLCSTSPVPSRHITAGVSDGGALSLRNLLTMIATAIDARLRVVEIKVPPFVLTESSLRYFGRIAELLTSQEVKNDRWKEIMGWSPPYTTRDALTLCLSRALLGSTRQI